jgi:hypothetical protein
VTKSLIETARFANTDDGYAQLARFAGKWQDRRWAVKGSRGASRSLAQRLVADGEAVLDVPAKLAARYGFTPRDTAARSVGTMPCHRAGRAGRQRDRCRGGR